MADKIGGIFVDLGLNSAAFSKGLSGAQGQVQKFAVVTKSSLASLGTSAFAGFAKGALAAAAPVLGLAAAVDTTKAALEQFGKVADQSAAAGVDAEFFQGIAHQAEMAGVEVDGLAGAMATFAKNSGLAAENKGRMVSSLAALNPELLKSIQLAGTQEERFLLVADAIAESKGAAEAAAIAAAAFGDQGTKLVAVLKSGSAEIQKMNATAKEMGLVIDNTLIAKADELGDKFQTATKIVDLRLKQAMINLAPAMLGAANGVAEFTRLLSIAGDQLNAIENRQYLRPLQNELVETYGEIDKVKTNIAELEAQLADGGPNGMILKLDVDEAKGKLADLQTLALSLFGRIQELQGYKPPTAPGAAPDPLAGMLGRGGPGKIKLAEPFYEPGGGSTGGANGRAQETIDQAQAVLEALQAEQAQLGATSEQQAIYNNLKAAGVTAESAMGQEITAATVELERQRAAIEANVQAMAVMRDMAGDVLHGFVDDIRAGVPAVEALGNAFDNLADKLIDMALDAAIMGVLNALFPGAGTAAGSLSSLIPGLGGFASGTANTGGARGQPRGIVHGQEAVIPLPNGGKVPVDVKMPTDMSAGKGGAIQVSVSVGVQDGNLVPLITQVSGEVASRKIEQRTPQIVKQVAPGAVRIANGNRTG